MDKPMPTNAELPLLQVLWDRGPCTVREVHDAVKEETGQGYTTVLKLMQIMAEKGLVRRDMSSRSHVYEAVFSEDGMQRRIVRDMLSRVFRGSSAQLVVQALSTKKASRAELNAIRGLLDELEGKKR